MPRSQNANKDPRLVPVQINIRVPWVYKAVLDRVAFDQGISVPNLVVEALETVYPPEPLSVGA